MFKPIIPQSKAKMYVLICYRPKKQNKKASKQAKGYSRSNLFSKAFMQSA